MEWNEDDRQLGGESPAPVKMTMSLLVGSLVLLIVRGFLLWFIVIATAVVWIALSPVFIYNRISLGSIVAWIDWNLVAVLQRILFLAFPVKAPWKSFAEVKATRHKVRSPDLL